MEAARERSRESLVFMLPVSKGSDMSASVRDENVSLECAAVVRIALSSGIKFCCFLACDVRPPDVARLLFELSAASLLEGPLSIAISTVSTVSARFFAVTDTEDPPPVAGSTIGQPKPARGVKSGLFARRMSRELCSACKLVSCEYTHFICAHDSESSQRPTSRLETTL